MKQKCPKIKDFYTHREKNVRQKIELSFYPNIGCQNCLCKCGLTKEIVREIEN